MNEQQIRNHMRDDGATDDEIEAVTDDLADEAFERQREDRAFDE